MRLDHFRRPRARQNVYRGSGDYWEFARRWRLTARQAERVAELLWGRSFTRELECRKSSRKSELFWGRGDPRGQKAMQDDVRAVLLGPDAAEYCESVLRELL